MVGIISKSFSFLTRKNFTRDEAFISCKLENKIISCYFELLNESRILVIDSFNHDLILLFSL